MEGKNRLLILELIWKVTNKLLILELIWKVEWATSIRTNMEGCKLTTYSRTKYGRL